ncbi:MAG TPA: hypothetical protein VHU81_06010 [Thermoanaerobaculia bacterium]|nr:hypothetical protein [Thermoanaerobaculia bacterium]
MKKHSVKLVLNRETLRQLDSRSALGRVNGGGPTVAGEVSTDQAWACGTKLSGEPQ